MQTDFLSRAGWYRCFFILAHNARGQNYQSSFLNLSSVALFLVQSFEFTNFFHAMIIALVNIHCTGNIGTYFLKRCFRFLTQLRTSLALQAQISILSICLQSDLNERLCSVVPCVGLLPLAFFASLFYFLQFVLHTYPVHTTFCSSIMFFLFIFVLFMCFGL